MLIILARIFVVIFTILVLSKSYLSFRQRKESLAMTIFWFVTWFVISLFTFYPDLIDTVLIDPRTRSGTGTILGIGLIFIYFVIYRVYIKADRVEKQLNKLIRDLALQKNRRG